MNNTNLPNFFPKINEKIIECWQSEGGVTFKFQKTETDYEMMFCPAIREIVGGAEDGMTYYPGFIFNIPKFIKLFDKGTGKVALDCVRNDITAHLVFSGNIDGNSVKIAILVAPPDSCQLPAERMYVFGPKKGTIEPVSQ